MAISHSIYSSAPIPPQVGGYEQPVIVTRQQKTTQKYYPYQLLRLWTRKNKALNSQASYHGLTSVLTKATGGAIGR